MNEQREKAIKAMNNHHRERMANDNDLNLDEKFSEQEYDSLDLVELTMAIEKELGITVDDERVPYPHDTPGEFLNAVFPE